MSKPIIDRVGNRYGKLVVISFAFSKLKVGSYWNCLCDCGNTVVKSGNSMSNNEVKSCSKSCGHTPLKASTVMTDLIFSYKKAANLRGFSYNLPRELFERLIALPCYYCGVVNSNTKKRESGKGPQFDVVLRYNGLDRVDNSVGYEVENVVTCCRQCNRAKDTMTHDAFISLCHRVAALHPLDTQSVAA